MINKTHGGRRIGSGRPRDPDKKKQIGIRFRPDQIIWLVKNKTRATSMAKHVEIALDQYIEKF